MNATTTFPGEQETPSQPYFEIRNSAIHGRGAFALRPLRKGKRLIEYAGERISNREADRRGVGRENDPHTFLFTLSQRTVVDASVGGNESRFINHSCDPNCEASIEDGHIYIDTLRSIAAREELTYDYQLHTSGRPTQAERDLFACHCGSPKCRGTMLAPYEPRRTVGQGKKSKGK